MITLKKSGVNRTVSLAQLKKGGVVRSVSNIQLKKGGVLRDLSGGGYGFSASASPSNSVGYGYSGSTIIVTTPYPVSVTVSGGVAPYTYSWEPNDVSWEATNPTSSSTTFRSPPLAPGDDLTTVFRCLVTDSTSATTYTNYVQARARNTAYWPATATLSGIKTGRRSSARLSVC